MGTGRSRQGEGEAELREERKRWAAAAFSMPEQRADWGPGHCGSRWWVVRSHPHDPERFPHLGRDRPLERLAMFGEGAEGRRQADRWRAEYNAGGERRRAALAAPEAEEARRCNAALEAHTGFVCRYQAGLIAGTRCGREAGDRHEAGG